MLIALARNLILWSVGLLWAVAGISKLVGLMQGSPQSGQVTWLSSFPVGLMVTVSILECMIAALIFARFRWAPIISGSALLVSFIIALWIWPPEYQQPCGCFGKIKVFDATDPVAKIIAFGGLHTLAAVLIWVRRSHGELQEQADHSVSSV